jgi:hypothetical protein
MVGGGMSKVDHKYSSRMRPQKHESKEVKKVMSSLMVRSGLASGACRGVSSSWHGGIGL